MSSGLCSLDMFISVTVTVVSLIFDGGSGEQFLLEEMVFSYNVNKDVTLVLFCNFLLKI